MNELKIFENEQFGKLRTATIDGEPWFVAKDVAEKLGYANQQKAIRDHVDEEDKGVNEMDTPGGKQELIFINESGVLSLILRSNLPAAKQFKRWITHEVIPSIRKTGGYIAGQETMSEDDLIEKALQVVSLRLAEREKKLNEANKKNALLEQENEEQAKKIDELQPKTTYYDAVLMCKNPVRTKVIARDYGWSAQQLNNWLAAHHIQYKQNETWLLYQKYANKGYTVQQTFIYRDFWLNPVSAIHTSWTQSGRLFIYEQLKKEGILPLMEQQDDDD